MRTAVRASIKYPMKERAGKKKKHVVKPFFCGLFVKERKRENDYVLEQTLVAAVVSNGATFHHVLA